MDERTRNSKVRPGSPSWLSQKLKRSVTFLRSVGINVEFPDQTKRGRERTLRITKCTSDGVETGEVSISSSDEQERILDAIATPIDGSSTRSEGMATSAKPNQGKGFHAIDAIDAKKPTHSSREDREVFEL